MLVNTTKDEILSNLGNNSAVLLRRATVPYEERLASFVIVRSALLAGPQNQSGLFSSAETASTIS